MVLYGPFFGKIWSKENKIKQPQKMPAAKLFYHLILVFITVFVVELIFMGGVQAGFALALIIWIGFILTNRLTSMVWMKQSWTLFFIDAIYHLANLVIIVLVLNAFR